MLLIVYVHVCMYVCIFDFMYMRAKMVLMRPSDIVYDCEMQFSMYTVVHTIVRCSSACTWLPMYVHVLGCVCRCTANACISAHTYACTREQGKSWRYSFVCVYIIYIYIYIYIYTYIHTYRKESHFTTLRMVLLVPRFRSTFWQATSPSFVPVSIICICVYVCFDIDRRFHSGMNRR